MSTDLYRYYDADGRLLYVGVSLSAIARAAAHRSRQGWWADVATMTVERIEGTRAEALAVERAAIKAERPLHNLTHNDAVRREREAADREQWIAGTLAQREYAMRVAAETRAAQGLPRHVDESVLAAAAAILAMAPVVAR